MKWTRLFRENLGLKIGAITGACLFIFVLLLLMALSILPYPATKFNFIQLLFVVGVMISLFAALILSFVTHVLILKPLNRLTHAIRQAESGDWEAHALISSKDEIGELSSQFNQMISKIDRLEKTRLDAKQQLTIAQEELRYKNLLEEKAEIISNTNRRLQESLGELSILFKISQALASSIDLQELCQQFCDVILANVPLQDFAILLLDEERKILKVQEARGFLKSEKIDELNFELHEGISGEVACEQKMVYIPDTSKNSNYLYYKGMKAENGSFLCCPMLSKQRTLGVVHFSRKGTQAFSQQEIQMLSTTVSQFSLCLENAQLYSKTKELSLVDDLTKIYNRRYFYRMLAMEFKRAKRFSQPLSLLMIDVDYFKKINDSLGHLEGDRILVKLASLLDRHLREVDTLARYGGEEFSVILPDTSLEDAHRVGIKLQKIVEELGPSFFSREARPLTVSVGVATLQNDAKSIDELIDQADIALYKAKGQGRNQVLVYQEESSLRGKTLPFRLASKN